MLGALTEAELGPADRAQDLTGASEDLTSHEEGDEAGGDALEGHITASQIVLVAAVRVPDRIRVVFEGQDGFSEPLLVEEAAGPEQEVCDDAFASLVVSHQIGDVVGFGGRIFRVKPAVEIEAAAILEEYIPLLRPGHRLIEDIADDVLA